MTRSCVARARRVGLGKQHVGMGRVVAIVLIASSGGGCASPYRADRGAVLGGTLGAVSGLAIGAATGNPLAGAAIGGGVGAISGAAIGGSLDEIDARNQAEIESRLGRPVVSGPVTTSEVVAMTQAGVDEGVIVTHIQRHGVAQVPTANDLIALQQQGVSPRVVQAMQLSQQTVQAVPSQPPVIIEHYPPPRYWGPPPPRYWGPPPYRRW